QAFMTPFFRVYTNYDMTGVQIGGALKNIIAIAAGMCKGLEYGSNTIAALMTRGIKEISRFGVFMGAEEKTFHGLSGIGDLITTCISDFSRNFFVGREMARGRSIRQVTEKMVMVAEGVETTRSVYHFAEQKQLDMPIAKAVYKVLFDALPPQQAVEELMTREAKSEN
ncbi:MAG TPA: NAD(P)H-dependent glycerol-3-phosphate dehydrogenase, partial [Spirochaetota bacterium]|nr:NAD(P)H-dependent glycerol-3-phosphate dehydrogenase [Spirochaetota bacterium]